MQEAITKTRLANGLLVLLKEIHSAPLISQWVWYRVGSRDEVPGITGISHWVEHMQFRGTSKFPRGVLDKLISREGGVWNAFTYLDWTAYFETLPADKVDLALQLEADRMANSLFDERDVEAERTVIISERQGAENEPLFLLAEGVNQAAFQFHPYRQDVIGSLEDLRKIQCEDLFRHYRSYYQANNAVLTLAGDFNTDHMLTRLEEYYAPIPIGIQTPRQFVEEPPQTSEQRVTVEGPGETTYVQSCWHVPASTDPDLWPLTVLDSLLTGPSSPTFIGGGISNKTSRLYQALVERELAVSLSGGISITIDPFLYAVTIIVRPERKVDEVLVAMDEEIRRLQDSPPSEIAVARAVKQARALFSYGSESITNQAAWLGFAEMFATYDWFTEYLDKLETVTPQDVQRVAQKYFQPSNRVLGIYKPTGNNLLTESGW